MTEPTLFRDSRGYWRCSWRDACGEKQAVYFGRNRATARNRYSAWLVRWRNDPLVRTPDGDGPLTIAAAVERFLVFARAHYIDPDGTPSRSTLNLKYALDPLVACAGARLAADIDPSVIDAYRAREIARGISLGMLNERVRIVRRAWKWLAGRGLVPVDSWTRLQTIATLKPGRSGARVTEPVRAVADEWIDATCSRLPPSLAAMVRIQRLAGMRPGEVCAMSWSEIDRSGALWIHAPRAHKTAHLGRPREILLGPRAQALLAPYLARDISRPIFSPRLAMQERDEAARVAYRPADGGYDYRAWESYRDRSTGERFDRGDAWTTTTYARAINRAAAAAGAPHWAPNQLRHAAATSARRDGGLEVAQMLLGHARANVTEIYAETDRARASAWVRAHG